MPTPRASSRARGPRASGASSAPASAPTSTAPVSAAPGWPLPPRALVGMVHVGALPGTPRHHAPMTALIDAAVQEARVLAAAGFDAILVENMHDVPYLRGDVGPEIVAAMAAVLSAIRGAVRLPLGVQILAAANCASVAVAHACGAQFIRAEGFVFSAVADEGVLLDADAGALLRFRRTIGGEHISILADIQKKHSSHAITADLDLGEFAKGAEFFGADAVVVTGAATGQPTADADVRAAKEAVAIPVVVGSGATPENLQPLLRHADAVIVGSWIKVDGRWDAPVDSRRAREFVKSRGRAGPSPKQRSVTS